MEDPSAAAWPIGADNELPYDMEGTTPMIDPQMPFAADPQSSFLIDPQMSFASDPQMPFMTDPQASPLRDPQASPIQDPQASPLLAPAVPNHTPKTTPVSSSPWWSVFLAVGGLICLILCLKWLMDQSPASLSTEGISTSTNSSSLSSTATMTSMSSTPSSIPSYTPPASFLDLDALNFI